MRINKQNTQLTCLPNQSPNNPPTICPRIIPAIKAELHKLISDEDNGGYLTLLISIRPNEMLIVLYAAEKLDIMDSRMSA